MLQGKTIVLVAAMDRNRGIGIDGRMPWHLPADLKQFKAITWGHPLIMGRKTFAAIGRPLPGRQNVVISRNLDYRPEGVDVAHSFDEAVEIAQGDTLMIVGGGAIYRLALPLADKLVLTLVDCEVAADTTFPHWQQQDWLQLSRMLYPADEANAFDFELVELVRA